MVKRIFLIESALIAILLSILLPLTDWIQLWIPIVTFLGSYAILSLLYLVYLYIVSLFIDTKKEYFEQNKYINKTVICTLEWLLNMAHVKVKVTGLEKLPNEKFMLVYNHTSNFDPIIQSYILKENNLIHISKPSNFKIPIAGNMVYRDCYISIDRDNPRNALKAIEKASQFIKNQQYCVGISPEGTRNKNDASQLLPFKPGAFHMALFAKCPIVVCEMKNVNKISKNFPFKRTVVEMNIIDVLPYENLKGLKTTEISNKVFKELQDKIQSN